MRSLDPMIWELLFPKNQRTDYLYSKSIMDSQAKEIALEDALKMYWKAFNGRPKPYIPNLVSLQPSVFKKMLDSCSTAPSLSHLIGRVHEDLLWVLFDKKKIKPSSSYLELALLYGYSEKLVLALCQSMEVLSPKVVKIAKLRGYSENFIETLEKKTDSPCSIL